MTGNITPRIVTRPFQDGADFGRVRDLISETYPITGLGFNWEIRRWDGWRYYGTDPAWQPRWEKEFHLWETEEGRRVGLAHHEGQLGEAHLEIHPDYRELIEADMIAWAEQHLSVPTEDGQGRRLNTVVFEYDTPRQNLLVARGYEKQSRAGFHRRVYLGDRALAQPTFAEGYTLHTTRPGNEEDFQRLADLLNAAFGRGGHVAAEYRNFTSHAACYRRALDLMAVAPDGSYAAHVGGVYDEANRRGLFEPVCTHPDHRRKGLAKALMVEGLHRLKTLGAVAVTCDTNDTIASNRLYDSVFTEAYQSYIWRKTWA
ncbi:GNAT family N-acetyltransferase [Chloroflexota bacterium]